MGEIVTISNQKGGVGKTTTTINLAASLVRSRQRVLLVDLDPQGNATVGSGVDRGAFEVGTYDLLVGDIVITEGILSTEPGFDLMPADGDLAGALVELVEMPARERILSDALLECRHLYDYILIDCPPSLSLLTLNALVAADAVLIPMQCEYYALEGVTALLETISKVRAGLNPGIRLMGVVRTMFDGRNTLSNEVSDQLREFFGEQLFRTIIPRNIRLAEAPSFGKPVIDYDQQCVGAQAYLALAGEFLSREESR
ncbi:MAG: ParA family protein [Arenicellales bacterium]|nr:ParA family protein [Arenicellales bacterium]